MVFVFIAEKLADGMTKALPYPTFLAISLNNDLYYYQFTPFGKGSNLRLRKRLYLQK